MPFADYHAKISNRVADCPFSLSMSRITCNNWLTLTFECEWHLVHCSNVRRLSRRSDIKHLVRRSNIKRGWPHMLEILRTWLDWFVRLIGPIGLVYPFHLALWARLKGQLAWFVHSIWHCEIMKTSHLWCQMEFILVQTSDPRRVICLP